MLHVFSINLVKFVTRKTKTIVILRLREYLFPRNYAAIFLYAKNCQDQGLIVQGSGVQSQATKSAIPSWHHFGFYDLLSSLPHDGSVIAVFYCHNKSATEQ